MADYDSSLPVRTEAAGDVDVFLSDATTPTQKLKVNPDGSIDTNFADGSKVQITDGVNDATVTASGQLNVKDDDLTFANDKVDVSGSDITATVSATDLDIRDLAFATDKVDVSGSDVTATVSATDLDIRDLAFATDKVDVSGSDITATVSATDLDIRDLSSAQDSVEVLQATHDNLNANANLQIGDADVSGSNPVPVALTGDQVGDEIVDYNTSASVGAGGSVNHDYTVNASKTFLGEEAWISGSGKLKVDLLVNGSVQWTGFNSTANPNIRIPLEKILKANAAEVVRFTITNRDKQPQDVYSTLSGLEV